MGIITEIVGFKTVTGVSDEQFTEIVDSLEREFHTKLPGFIDTELLRGDEPCSWMMIQHWQTIDHVKAAAKKMFQESVTENFRKHIDPKSVKMSMLNQVKTWDASI